MNLDFGKYKDQSIENVFLKDPQYLIKTLSCSPMRHDMATINYIEKSILSKPKKQLMDYDRLIKYLKNYLDFPEVIMYDVLKGLLGNELLSHNTYDAFKKRWNKIKHYTDDEVYYQDFIYDLGNAINNNMKWCYEIGRFALPKDNCGIVMLSCEKTLATKLITIKIAPMIIKIQRELPNSKLYVSGNNHETKLLIDDDTTMNFNNIKKCIKVCETLHMLNSCKKCNKTVIFTSDYEFCSECLNNAAKKIQEQWKICIANPQYTICQNRLMNEFNFMQ
jgi:hypothetical protein